VNWRSVTRRFRGAYLYEEAVDVEPLAEEMYRMAHALSVRPRPARRGQEVYRRCRRYLSIVLGIAPAAATEALYRGLARNE
jgi:hypothetical protein